MDTPHDRTDGGHVRFRPLYTFREARGLTRVEVARLLEVSYSAILKAETTDPYAIGLDKYQKLSQLWGIPLHRFDPPNYRHFPISKETTL